ncbi:MAG: putative rane protein [Mycobacterium sp.]|jgi:hypothetical protein|nr:putative rane protein [Mycobacterium sp.]
MHATLTSDAPHRNALLLDAAQLGIAQWLFGNVYEAVVRIPELLSDQASAVSADERPRSILGAGSPVRYYAAGAPLTTVAIVAALIAAPQDSRSRRWLRAAIGCWLGGAVVTAYLVRTVNLPLFFSSQPLPADKRSTLIRTWYRWNAARIAAAAAALAAAHRASQTD